MPSWMQLQYEPLDNNQVLMVVNSYRDVFLPPPYPTFLLRPSEKRDKKDIVFMQTYQT